MLVPHICQRKAYVGTSEDKNKSKNKSKDSYTAGNVNLCLFPTHAKGRHMWATSLFQVKSKSKN